jgi:hypothetical protein
MRKIYPLLRPLAWTLFGVLLGKFAFFSPVPAPSTQPDQAHVALDTAQKSASTPKRSPSGNQALPKNKVLDSGAAWTPFTGSAEDLLATAYAIPGRRDTVYFVYRAVEDVDSAQLATFVADLASQPVDRAWQPEALKEAVSRWSSLDSSAAVAWVQTLPNLQKNEALPIVLGSLAAQDTTKALALLDTISSPSLRQASLNSITDAISARDPATACALSAKYLDKADNGSLSTIFENWGTQDPTAALAGLASLTPKQQDSARSTLFSSWAAHDPQAALAAASTLKDPKDQDNAKSVALYAWVRHDIKGAVAWFQTLSPSERVKLNGQNFVNSVARTDPKLAISLADSLGGNSRTGAMQSVAAIMAQTDLAGTLKWMKGLTNAADQIAIAGTLGVEAARESPEKLLSTLAEMKEGPMRKRLLENLISNSNDAHVETLLSLMPKLSTVETKLMLESSNVMTSLARKNPAAAMDLLKETSGSTRDAQLSNLAQGFAEEDKAAAYTWATQLPSEDRAHALPQVLAQMATDDGAGAYQKAQLITDPDLRGSALDVVLNTWSNNDSDAVERLLPQLIGEDRSKTLGVVANAKINQDTDTGADYLLGIVRSGRAEDIETLSNQGSYLGNNWGRQDPTAATTWAQQLPEGNLKNNFLSSVADSWTQSDPTAASSWINGLPTGTTKDHAAHQLVQAIQESDPESAAVWAGQIQNEAQRTNAYVQTFETWLRKDRSTAERALAKIPLNADTKANLLGTPQPER